MAFDPTTKNNPFMKCIMLAMQRVIGGGEEWVTVGRKEKDWKMVEGRKG